MSGLISHGKLVLVERDAGGFDIAVYNDHLHMIESLINSGCIGDNIYGTPAHLDALSHLEGEIAVVRGKIMKHNAEMEGITQVDACGCDSENANECSRKDYGKGCECFCHWG